VFHEPRRDIESTGEPGFRGLDQDILDALRATVTHPGLDEVLRQRFHGELPALVRLLRITPPPHRPLLSAIVATFAADPPAMGRGPRRLLQLARRLARPPFPVAPDAVALWRVFTGLDGVTWSRFRHAPAHAFTVLASRAEPGLVAALADLVANAPEACVTGFIHRPEHFFKAIGALAAIAAPARLETISAWQAHPLFDLDAATDPFSRLVALACAHLPPRLNNPVPRKLRDVVAGKQRLSPDQEARIRRVIGENLHETRLGVLTHLARQRKSGPPRC